MIFDAASVPEPMHAAIPIPSSAAPQSAGSRPFSIDQPIVLLVHPADGLVEALTIGLSQAGLSTIAAKDIHQVLQIMETMQPDAVVLHCPQGSLTAADAYAKVRALTKAPVVLLVGGNEPLAAEFTDGSAHGVLVLRRPLRFPELVDALHSLISQADPASALGSLGSEVLAVGDVILDERAHAVKVRGQLINMPGKEYEVLRVLLGFAGQAISRERIIELVWGTDIGRGRRNLHTHIKRLRHRIERDPANPEYIITIHGYGWRFAAPSNNNDIA